MRECEHIYGYEYEFGNYTFITKVDENTLKEYEEEEWWKEHLVWFKWCPMCGKPIWHGRVGGNNG